MSEQHKENILFLEYCPCKAAAVRGMLETAGYNVIPVLKSGPDNINPDDRNRADLIIIITERGKKDKSGFGNIIPSGSGTVPVIFLLCGPAGDPEKYPDDIPVYAYYDCNSDPAVIMSSVRLALKWSRKSSSERMYEILINGMNEGVYVIDFAGKIIDVNDNAAETLGYTKEEIYSIGLAGIDGALSPEIIKGLAASMPADEIQVFETTHKTKDGRAIPMEIISSIITYKGRKAILSMARDISNRRQMEEQIKRQLQEKEILIKATHHRVKNNIASIAALISLQKTRTDNPEVREALKEAESRIHCMHVLYDTLLKHDSILSVRNYLEALRDSIFNLYRKPENIEVESRIEDIALEEKIIFALGVVFEELLTNIMKYAFPADSGGKIRIIFEKTGDTARLTVRDNGKGIPEKLNEAEGFGITIVRILSEQLEAEFAMKNDSGTCSTFQFKCC